MSIPSTTVSTTNLASDTANAKQSKDTFFDAINKLNGTLAGINTANNLCPLDAQGKITTDKILGRIDNSSFANRAVVNSKINAGATAGTGIENVKFRDNQILTSKLSEVTTDTTLGGNNASTSKIPSSGACKSYIDNSSTTTSLMRVKYEFGDITKANRDDTLQLSNSTYNFHRLPTPTIATPTPFNFITTSINSFNNFQYIYLEDHPYLVIFTFSGTTHTHSNAVFRWQNTHTGGRSYYPDQQLGLGSYINASTTQNTPRSLKYQVNMRALEFRIETNNSNTDYGFKDFTLEIIRIF
jgi:hypothetical protein